MSIDSTNAPARSRQSLAFLLMLAAASCGHNSNRLVTVEGIAVVEEAYFSDFTRPDNIDSPAIWHAHEDAAWILATGKSSHQLVVYDATTGETLGRIGRAGSGPGEFLRPNGIVVVDSLAFVVERDNRRVQVISLPTGAPIGSFGEAALRSPYGIALVEYDRGEWEIYVTDAYTRFFGRIPPNDQLGERVKRFRVHLTADTLRAELMGSFGSTSGPGVLRQVESIYADPQRDRLLIADEASIDIKVYTLQGEYTGQTIGREYLHYEPEGIALYECGDDGYWLVTDQSLTVSYFHVIDRGSLERLGVFQGRTTANTDGVALTQGRVGDWEEGVLFPVHDDRAVSAIPWSKIADALDLESCEVD